MTSIPSRGLSFGLVVLTLAGAARAQTFTISQQVGGDNFGARSAGQTFTPGIGVTPNPQGLPVLFLTSMTLYAGNSGANAPNGQTYLNIYDGDPNAGGAFVGSSTNTIDTNNLTFRTPLPWSFPSLPLITTTEYWAVMSSSSTSGGLNIEVSLETEPRNGPPGPNIYTGGAGLIANVVPHPNSVDARFEAVFFFGVMGTFQVSGTGCAAGGSVPTLSAQGVPQLGQPFQVDFASLSSTGLTYAVLGFDDTMWNGVSLPVALQAFVPGASAACQVLVAVDDALILNRMGTSASLLLPMPSAANFAGLPFFLQAAQIDGSGFSLSAKGAAVLGN